MSEAPDRLPRHVAVIMDGNGRWARRRGLSRTEGHRAGAESARLLARLCLEFGIPVLTLYSFSTENWRRPRREVQFLMSSLRRFLAEERQEMVENDIRLRAIGALEELPPAVQRELNAALEATAGCSALQLVLALNYGSHRELVEATRAIARRVRRGELEPEQIGESTIEEHLYTAGLPAPDLLIRTGGQMRLSNFLLWQCSYTELYVTGVLWPDFSREDFLQALRDYAGRERRFGGLGDGAPTGADTLAELADESDRSG